MPIALAPRAAFLVASIVCVVLATPARAQVGGSCQPQWLPSSGGQTDAHGIVNALATFDDGTGPALYAGGHSMFIEGSLATPHLLKWDGTNWSIVPGDPQGLSVRSLAVHDDGSGTALFVGGAFTLAGGAPANAIARWNGATWAALAGGITGGVTFPSVHALCVFDEGDGPKLFAGGQFVNAGGVATGSLARWDGGGWTTVGQGLSAGPAVGIVHALAVFDRGDGPALYVAGGFALAGQGGNLSIARWDGAAWDTTVHTGLHGLPITSLVTYDDGFGAALYAGGAIFATGTTFTNNIARYSGLGWSPLGAGVGAQFQFGAVQALRIFDDGRGPSLFVGGAFTQAGGLPANRIARWDGSQWHALDNGLAASVNALAVHDDGTGQALYAGGVLLESPAGGTPLAKWGGCAPSPDVTPYGSGLNPPGSLVVLQGAPQLGGSITFGVSNPLTSSSGPAFAALAVAVAPAPGFPGGIVLPGYGLAGPFAPGELLVDLAAPNVALGPTVWPGGTSAPAAFALGLPPDPALAGLPLFAQGLLVSSPVDYGSGLTNGLGFLLAP